MGVSGFATLTDFLADLERRGDLRRVSREVDWAYEVTEIACREARAEGPALLFERVRGSAFPLAVNVLAARHGRPRGSSRSRGGRVPPRCSSWSSAGRRT